MGKTPVAQRARGLWLAVRGAVMVALFSLLAGFSSTALAGTCAINWSLTNTGSSSYTYPFTGNDYTNCDPNQFGVYSDPGATVQGSVTTSAQGSLAVDSAAYQSSLIDQLTYTPPSPAYTGTDTATLYAYDATGINVNSVVVTITVRAKPGAPTIGSATAGDTQATVNFTAPASNGGSAITGYTATANPGGATATGTASPLTVTGLTNGTAYTFTVTATNAIGTGPSSAASNAVTPKASQSITFANPGAQTFGSTPILAATATSGLTPTFSSATTSVCTITSGGALTFITAGTCSINADQAGNSTYLAATTVSRSFNVVAIVPGAPTIGTATAGDTQVTVSFTAPGFTGGATITSYTATASPGGATGTGVSSPITVSGLTDGTAYTFTVTATNSAGTGAASAASNSVTPKASQSITFANPGAQNFGTTPTLTATATSGLSVSFSSSTTAVCTITSGGALTFIGTGTCTINADQAGNGNYLAASTVSRSFTVNAVVSGAPVIGMATAGDTQATVSFTAPGFTGGATIANYTVTSSPGGLTAAGASSPVLVTGLTNGTAYTFTVTATNSVGTSAASAPSNAVTPKASQTISFTNPGTQNVGATPTLTATASSGLPVTFSSSSTSVCTIASGGALTIIRAGTCIINADQAGNGAYLPATTVTQSFTVNGPAIAVSPGTLPNAAVGASYNQTVTASGGTAPYTFAISAGALPAGMSFSPSGVLSAVPTASGTFGFTITATDANGATGSSAYTMTVAAPTLAISPAAGALSATAGTAYSSTFSGSGGTSPYTYALVVASGTMPAGLSWNAATATLSGTPAAAGTVTFNLTAIDSSTGAGAPFATTRIYTLTVSAPAIAVTPATLPNPSIAVAYSQSLSASGGTAPYTYAVAPGTLPTGLALSPGGVLSGTPTAGGAFSFTVTVTDANSFTASRAYSFTIGAPTVAVNPAAVTAAQVTTAYSQTFSATGGTAPYTYTVSSGTLPAGLNLNASTGVVSGTPAALGSSTFTVRATDSSTGTGAPYSGTRSYTLVVGQVIGTAPATTVTTLSNAPVTVQATANATGGPFSSVAIVSPPASGTAVVNGLDIVYTPAQTSSGAVNFTYALINTAGTSAPIPVTVNVNAAPIAVAQKQAATSSGQAVSVDLTEGATGGPFTGASLVSVVPANAGTASIVQKAVQAPAGLKTQAVPASTYVLSFTPSGTYSGQAVLTYTLSNAFATSVPATVQVSVAARKDPSADPDVAGLINAQIQAARRFATTQIDNYSRRLEALHGAGRAPSGNGLSIAMPGQRVDMQARCQDVVGISAHDACLRGDGQGVRPFARGKRTADATNDKPNADTGPDLPGADTTDADNTDPNLAFWSAGTLDFGFANTGAQRSGFRFTTGGVTAGADYRVSDQFSVGAGFGYGRDSTDIGNAGTKSTGDSYSVALYGSYRPLPSLFVDGVAGFGTLSFDSRRWVTDANDFATGKRNGKQMFASVSAGYEHRDRTWLVSPYGRLSVSQSTLDQFSESGAGFNALTYFEQTVTTVSGTLGLRAEYTQKTKWGTLLPFVRVEYQHDFNGQTNAGLAYADLASAGPAYYVPGTPFGRDRMQIGLGTKFRTGPLTFGLDYSVMAGMGGVQQGVRLTFAAPF